MTLLKKLTAIEAKNKKRINTKTRLKIIFTDGTELIGLYRDYTSALDNEPEIASIGLLADDGTNYELYENEIDSIELV